MSARKLVRQFEEATGGVVRDVPTALSRDELELRSTLIIEEVAELLCALAGLPKPADEVLTEHFLETFDDMLRNGVERDAPDLVQVAKELCDVEVVLHGTAHYSGIDMDVAFPEVHSSNMSKVIGAVKRPDGKVLKGPNYRPPNPDRLLGRGTTALMPAEPPADFGIPERGVTVTFGVS